MKLSIIIPVYNVEEHLAQCLDSVLNQDLDVKDYEVIIVNDGSTDGSLKMVQSYAEKHHHIKIIDKENGGVSTARNTGLLSATGKYIYFFDSDDYLLPNSLKKLVDTCESNNLDVLTFGSKSFLPTDKPIPRQTKIDASLNEEMLSQIVSGQDYVANLSYGGEVWLFLINHDFLKTSGIKFVEGQYLEDAIFTLSVFLEAKKMAHLKFDVHRYRVAPGSAMTNQEPNHYLRIIRDLLSAATAFYPIIKRLENEKANPDCIKRVKARQQSFVFFAMIRMFKSIISINEVKQRIHEARNVDAYPLNSFLGKDYKGVKYQILVRFLNSERTFYFFFRLLNPALKNMTKF